MSLISYIRIVVFGYAKQSDFAALLDIGQSRLSRLETGETAMISPALQKHIYQTAQNMGIDLDATLFLRPLSDAERIALLEAKLAIKSGSHDPHIAPATIPVMGKGGSDFPTPAAEVPHE